MGIVSNADAIWNFFDNNSNLLLTEFTAMSMLTNMINSHYDSLPPMSTEAISAADMSWQQKVDLFISRNETSALELQTPGVKHSRAVSTASAKGVLTSRAQRLKIAEAVRSHPRYASATRSNIYLEGLEGIPSSGGGGIDPLDPDLRTGMVWDPLDTEAIKFDIYDVAIKGFLPARRPGRGGYLEGHPERYSTIRVLNSRGEPIYATTNFTLESIHKPRKERLSPQITFDEVIARFGPERMKVFSFSGKLLDYKNFDWMREWESVWDKFLRGEVLAKNLWRAYVLSAGSMYGGYMLSNNIQQSIQGPGVPFSFTMLITDIVHLPSLTLVSTRDEALLGDEANFKGSPEEFASAMEKLNKHLQRGFPSTTKNKGPMESRGEKPTSIERGN